jgi:competence protein ComEC
MADAAGRDGSGGGPPGSGDRATAPGAPGQGAPRVPVAIDAALAVLAVASAIQWSGRLPSVSGAAVAAAVLAAAARVLASERLQGLSGPRLRRLARIALCASVAAVVLAARIEAGLAGRLDPRLEGQLLELDVTIDRLPDRGPFGDRLTGAVDRCRVMAAAVGSPTGEGDGPGNDAPRRASSTSAGRPLAGCANLSRVQMVWALQRQRDRADDETSIWPLPGERWRITAHARQPAATVNPGAFDLELRLLEEGVGALLRVRGRSRIDVPGPRSLLTAPGITIERWRTSLRDRFEQRVRGTLARAPGDPWQSLALANALALGDQRGLPSEAWGLFSRTGVAHLMSISGLHVTLLAWIASVLVGWALRGLASWRVPVVLVLTGRLPRQRIVAITAVAFAFGYALLSGWGIASQRTCWMLFAATCLAFGARAPGPFGATLLATLPVVVLDPWAVSAAGFWLSFGAVLALVWQAGGQGSHDRVRSATRWRTAIGAQWAATVALLPLTVVLFASASIVGPLVNVIAIPWISLLVTPVSLLLTLTASLPSAAASGVDPWAWTWRLLDWAIDWMMVVLQAIDGWSLASVRIADPPLPLLVAALLGAAWLLAPQGLGSRWLGLAGIVPLVVAGRMVTSPESLRVTAFDVGLGSAILVEAADAVVLIDTGGGRPGASVASRVIVPWLARRGIDRIDALVVSHRDREHAAGVPDVVAALSPSWLVGPFEPAWLPIAADAVQWQPCRQGERLVLGSLALEMAWPDRPAWTRVEAGDNRRSCVLRVVHRAGSLVAAGDFPALGERALFAPGMGVAPELAADLLVVPGQGSQHAAGESLIAAVAPKIALLQAARGQRQRSVHPSLVERIERHGARLLRTDLDGAIMMILRSGSAPEIRRLRRDAPPYWRIVDPMPSAPGPLPPSGQASSARP